MEDHGWYINGALSSPRSAELRESINPSDTSDVIGRFAYADESVVDSAVQAAREALPAWSRTSPLTRANLLEAVASTILAESASLAELLAREEGKTRAEALGEVQRAGQIFRFFSGEALRMTGELQNSTREGISVAIHREPVGVVGIITPWNFPLAIPAWKSAPALAFGNTVVMKPADLVPAVAHALARIIDRAGFPPGVFNLVTGPGSVVGNAIVGHEGVDAVTFTGSESVGRTIATTASSRFARVQLEMGGKNPMLVLADADLDIAVECAINGAFFQTGQRCTASSRILVEASIHDRFVDRVLEGIGAMRVGHALEAGTDMGPVVDARQLATDERYLDLARAASSTIVHGGERVKRDTDGFFLSPALIVGGGNDAVFNREEIFGPIASIIAVDDYEDGLRIANDTPYGLAAGICTTSLAKATDFQARADAGMVMVNLPTAGVDPHVPFGGRKGSSYGPREQGAHARQFFTQTKTAYVRP
jgi:acyl-CoA reductase-like NAD-dependent aldehyde dehydrogenase